MSTPIPFENRWLITGTLTTRSELHIGDGGAGSVANRTTEATGNELKASTVCVDHEDRAFIPGSGIKGALRARLSEDAVREPWRSLFGSTDPNEEDAVGGKLAFHDAFHCGGKGGPEHQAPLDQRDSEADRSRPWWDDRRKTCVSTAVSLDRRTRTARENLLFSLEYVPVGESFRFQISGDNLTENDIASVLALLASFNSNTTLGAGTSNGWGHVTCKIEEVACVDWAAVEKWKRNPTSKAACAPVDDDIRQRIKGLREKVSIPERGADDTLTIHLALAMKSPWLIRDTRQRERREHAGALPKDQKPPNAVPIHDEEDRPFIPARSLRGALRSRAEMILRTVGESCADHPQGISPVSTKGKKTEDVLTDLAKEDLAAKLFGLSGWRAPLSTPRFTPSQATAEHHQEFVAIDRFTGGAAEGAKFDARLAGLTSLVETLTIDIARLKKVDPDLASLGLLALVLRDLAEGDIPLGSGSAKGQGFCTAAVTWGGRDLLDPECSAAKCLTEFHKSIKHLAKP